MAPGIITRIRNNQILRSPYGIMKVCVAVSILFHLFLLMGIRQVFPGYSGAELKSYNIEVIRPPTEGLDSEDPAGTGSLAREKAAPSEDSQDTISLDTKDERYIEYTGLIKKELSGHWDYPNEARVSRVEGEVMALFTISRDGGLEQTVIEGSSGHEILDREVIRAIRASAPFPAFPESIRVSRLNIKARFDYRLSSDGKDK
jgi:TonB family protein